MEVKEGKHLTFTLKDENYGIPLGRVKEIIAMLPITTVPKTPKFIKGVINLRGKIIPIMDLRLKFGLEEKTYTERTCIIVVDIHTQNMNKQMGLAVDNVSEVLDIKEAEIEVISQTDTQIEDEFIVGIGKVKSRVVMLLDVERVLSKEEAEKLKVLGEE